VRIALSLSGRRHTADAVEVARYAEALGFHDVWVTEDYCQRGAFALAGAIARATEQVRVGIGVVNPWTRHPMLLAMEFAALDEVSHARGILGLGASNPRWMTDQLGIEFDRPVGRLREAVDIIRTALAGERVDHDGSHFRVHAELDFTPVRPRPPIVLGVKGRQALAMSAERADGLLLSILSSPAYVAWVRRRLGPDLELSAYVSLAVDPEPARARDRLRTEVATYLGVHGEHDITRVAGLSPEQARAFREGWQAGRPRTDLVDDALVDTFAVAGTPDQAATGMAAFADAGLDTLVVRDDPAADPEQILPVLAEIHAGLRVDPRPEDATAAASPVAAAGAAVPGRPRPPRRPTPGPPAGPGTPSR
jgi:5,10-methylenetetrahydromethanopterin reductase